MFSFLKNHPFAVEAHFDTSVVLTFAAPKSELQHLIPECLELDTFKDEWAFIAVAMVQTRALRPAGLPTFLGSDFFLIGYRLFVRFTNNSGKRVRGLYILRSETDRKKMEVFGSIFTQYKYSTADICRSTHDGITTVSSDKTSFAVSYESGADSIDLPSGSPFTTWKEARRFAGPLPFTFSFQRENNRVLIIEGVRQNWDPKPINVIRHNIPFLDSLDVDGLRLANAFIISDIPYRWKKGRIEKWNR